MHSYAQTNIQLFMQLRNDGYTDADLRSVRKAYDAAVRLFTGRVARSGKTSIAHAVGTASILGSLRVPVNLVAAGLLHNAYQNGDFGDRQMGMTPRKRLQVSSTAGSEVEQYVAGFASLSWNKRTIPGICESLVGLGSIDREVVLIRLADHLEHHLDHGLRYFETRKGQQLMDQDVHVDRIVDMAEQLGFPAFATELNQMIQDTAAAEIPVALQWRNRLMGGARIPPRSYRLRLSITLYKMIVRSKRVFRRAFRLRKSS